MPPSFSGLERFVLCPASSALAQAGSDSKPARRGTFLHKFGELVRMKGRNAALDWARENAEDSDWVIVADSIPLELFEQELEVEVAFAMSATDSQAMLLGYRLERNYQCPEGWIPGTADLVGVSGDVVYIGDWKFGNSWIAPVASSFQLRAAALCAMRVFGKSKAVIENIICREGRAPFRDRAEVDLFELEATFEPLIHRAWSQYQTAKLLRKNNTTVDVVQGDHCRYCNARFTCPAKTALAVRVGQGKELSTYQSTLPLSRKDAADAYIKAKAMIAWLTENVLGVCHAMASEEPLELADGRVLGEVSKPGNERLDGAVVRREVLKAAGTKAAELAITTSATKSSVKRALKEVGTPGYTRVAEDIFEAVRKAGGASRPTRTSLTIYKPKDKP